MFRIVVILIILIMIFEGLSAQKKIVISESIEKVGEGRNNVLVVNILEADKSVIEKAWKSMMKDYGAKVSMGKEIFADNAVIKTLSDNTVDIYARIDQSQEGEYMLMAGFDLGGAYLSSSMHPDKYREAKRILYDFAVKTTKEGYKLKLAAEDKVLSRLEKDKEDLVKANDKLNKDIADCKARIAQAEKDIETNLLDQENKQKEVDRQKKNIEEISQSEKTVE
jgi:hypothetical protein